MNHIYGYNKLIISDVSIYDVSIKLGPSKNNIKIDSLKANL